MFCFQSPFARASRGIVPGSSLGAKTKNARAEASSKRRGSEATSEGSGSSSIRYIDQEPSISEGSSTDTLPGIRIDYLDVEPLSPGARDSLTSPSGLTVVLNGIDSDDRRLSSRASPASCSPPSSGNGNTSINVGSNVNANGNGNGNGNANAGGGRWRKKLLLRLRASDSSDSSNAEISSSASASASTSASVSASASASTSSSPGSDRTAAVTGETPDDLATGCSSSLVDEGKAARAVVAEGEEEEERRPSARAFLAPNDINDGASGRSTSEDLLSLENGFDDGSVDEEEDYAEEYEEEDYVEEENATEEASSLPSSPAAASTVALASTSTVPYYDFLSVSATTMRQETTSTSSPQLSDVVDTDAAAANVIGVIPSSRSSSVDSPAGDARAICAEGTASRLDSLKSSVGDTLQVPASLPAARSCPNLERQSTPRSSIGVSVLPSIPIIATTPTHAPAPLGPRFKPLEEGDIQVCYFNHTRTLVRKILSSKFLRRWETHHLYLNDACLSSKTATGFLQQPIPYSSMSEVRKYAVARWDPTYKNCLSIVLPDGSLLLQANNAYTRDQWYHSILWKKSIFKYQHLASMSAQEDVILRELRSMVDFALWTPLQDERVAGAPLEAVARLLEESREPTARKTELEQAETGTESKREGGNECEVEDEEEENKGSSGSGEERSWAESVLAVAAPLLERAAPPASLARALARLAQQHPRSPLVAALAPAVTRCLKHTVDFGKAPDMRKLLQVFVAALYEGNDGYDSGGCGGGERAIREYIGSVHGPGSDCPHPRVLPNLVSVCVAAIFHRFEVVNRGWSGIGSGSEDKSSMVPPLDCYLLVLNVASEYADWRPGLAGLLQPVPFPEEALAVKEVQRSIIGCAIRRLAEDPRCTVHRVLLPVREPRPGWIHIAAPSSPACPDQGELFGEMLTTLLACCCRRKRFIGSLMKQAGDDCILLAVRGCDAAQEALCLMLEWRLLPNEEARLQIVNALESTTSGKTRYAALCQRQRNLQELQQKGGPRKLTLPVRATDADVALLLGGRALGNLECLSLAFTSVTSACAEQLIKLPALRYLNLWATQFGDAGLQMISEHLQKLQVLNLCETPVSDKGISTLASLTSLRKLNLNSTKLSAQTFESLKKRLPALQEFDVRYTEAW
ncbi:hypothetical protein KPH14_006083 [Odynerus spinipes]|uniref:C-Maf-inducing protein PH domain-containing protein n=1 Tax=Odynerus spinipes TaxID=1348599 RepID=A0AAD9RJY8_9HYME|nr:hypothetical protein KPH14_006083 [Odynerus spinipes]